MCIDFREGEIRRKYIEQQQNISLLIKFLLSNIINNRLNSIKMKHFNLYFNRIFHFQLNRFRNDWRSMHTPTPVHCSNHIKQR